MQLCTGVAQPKRKIYWFLLNFMKNYSHFFVLCGFVIFFCFGMCEFMLIVYFYLYIGLVKHINHDILTR